MITLADTDPRRLALDSGNTTSSPLVKVDFTDGSARFCLADSDIVVDGETWSSAGALVALPPITASRVPSRETFDVTFADPVVGDNSRRWIDRFTLNNSYIGINIWIGKTYWYNRAWTAPLTIFTGRCVQVISSGAPGGQVTVASFAGELVRIDDNPPLKLTRANLKQRNQSDTLLDYVTRTLDLQFGKKVE